MSTNNNNLSYDTKEVEVMEGTDFLSMFYEVLFRPGVAAQKIKYLRKNKSTTLFIYSLIVLLLGHCGASAYQDNLKYAIFSSLTWTVVWLMFSMVAWLFRSDEDEFDAGLLFCMAAFAQSPLIFLGACKLWATSILGAFFFKALFSLWSVGLCVWAISNGLKIRLFKALMLHSIIWVGPILFLSMMLFCLLVYGLLKLGL